jgi:hypothetical protein
MIAMFTLMHLLEGTDNPYDKFYEVALKHLESATTIDTLLLGAIAYLATKRLLEVAHTSRPRLLWVIVPSVFAIAALVIIQWAYIHIENALLSKIFEDFGVWWQQARVLLLICLVLGTVSFAVSFVVFSKRETNVTP